MDFLYVVVDVKTGNPRFNRAYVSARDAKLALKNRLNRRDWDKHAVASVKVETVVLTTVDADGNWTEVSAE